jgi:hypothetical protein
MNAGETPAAAGWLVGLPCVRGQVSTSRPLFSVSVAGGVTVGVMSTGRSKVFSRSQSDTVTGLPRTRSCSVFSP